MADLMTFTTESELSQTDDGRYLHTFNGQACTVLYELGDDTRDPEVGPMWHVRFEDGTEADAFGWELTSLAGTPPESETLTYDNDNCEWRKRD